MRNTKKEHNKSIIISRFGFLILVCVNVCEFVWLWLVDNISNGFNHREKS